MVRILYSAKWLLAICIAIMVQVFGIYSSYIIILELSRKTSEIWGHYNGAIAVCLTLGMLGLCFNLIIMDALLWVWARLDFKSDNKGVNDE